MFFCIIGERPFAEGNPSMWMVNKGMEGVNREVVACTKGQPVEILKRSQVYLDVAPQDEKGNEELSTLVAMIVSNSPFPFFAPISIPCCRGGDFETRIFPIPVQGSNERNHDSHLQFYG